MTLAEMDTTRTPLDSVSHAQYQDAKLATPTQLNAKLAKPHSTRPQILPVLLAEAMLMLAPLQPLTAQ